jgi:hypothetical protein
LSGHATAYLNLLRLFGPGGPTVITLYRLSAGPAVVYPVVVVALAVVAITLDWCEPGWLLLGLATGVLIRDNALFRQTVRVWPAAAAVTDWGRVAALTGGPATRSEGAEQAGPPTPTVA